MKDIQVINDVLNGETDKYSLLIDKYHNELFLYLYNIMCDHSDSETLLQEVFYKTFQHFDRFDASIASYRIWMYRSTSKYLMKYLKYNQGTFQKCLIDDHNKEANELLQIMSKSLRPKQFKILSLCFFSSLDMEEISKALNSSLKSIQRTVERSLIRIHRNHVDCAKINRNSNDESLLESKEKLLKIVMNQLYEYRKEHK